MLLQPMPHTDLEHIRCTYLSLYLLNRSQLYSPSTRRA